MVFCRLVFFLALSESCRSTVIAMKPILSAIDVPVPAILELLHYVSRMTIPLHNA